MPNLLVTLKTRLKANRERSAAARAAVVRRIATMTPEELRRVPTRVWTRLGAEDFAELVRQSQALARLAPQKAEAPTDEKPATTRFAGRMLRRIKLWNAVEPLWWVVGTSTVKSACVASMIVLATPGAITVAEDMEWVQRPFFCARLDRWAHECHYIVGSENLTLEGAARRLHLPYDVIARANFPLPPGYILPRGTRLWVPPRRIFDLFR
jgi:hypothetical protein